MSSQHNVYVDGFSFILMSYGYQPNQDADSAKSAYVAINVDEYIDEEKRGRFLSAISSACELAQQFDMMIKASEFVSSDIADVALQTWENGRLHGHALLCDAAIYISEEHDFPLDSDLKTKLREWNRAAAKKIYGDK